MKKLNVEKKYLEMLCGLWNETKGTDDYMKYTTQYEYMNTKGVWTTCCTSCPIFTSEKLFKTSYIKKTSIGYWIYIENEYCVYSITNDKERYLITKEIGEFIYNNIEGMTDELLSIKY